MKQQETRTMTSLSAAAEQLRTIRKAQERFLAMYALECIFDQKAPYDRLAQDLAMVDGPAQDADSGLTHGRLFDF
jgi:hypothetical protein